MFVKFHAKPISISEEICILTWIHLPILPMEPHKWLLGPPETSPVEARCHFAINFTTLFHKLHIIRDSKTPVEQPPSLDGTNPREDLAYKIKYQLAKFTS